MKYDSWKLPKPRATRTVGSFLQHIAHAAGVAVQDQFIGVADGGERRVHRIARAQNARTRRRAPPGRRGRRATGLRPMRRHWR